MKSVFDRRAIVGTLLCGIAANSLGTAAPAFAQDVAEQATSSGNDIVVTAQRRSELLEEVPMAVTVVTNETLTNAGVTSLRDLGNITSGYQLGAGGAFPQPSVRGVTTLINGTFENNVAVYVDGLYQPSAQGINIDLPNVDNIQVLKGPQGTLYGRNATGGALLLTTINPTADWRAKAELTYARFDDKRAAAYVAGPINDSVGFSLSGYTRRSDGYVRLASRTTPGETSCCGVPLKQDSVRFKVKMQLADTLDATVAYNYTRVSSAASNVFSPLENVPGSVYVGTPASPRPAGATRPTRLGVVAYDLESKTEAETYEGGLTLDWDVGFGSLKSITGYAQTTVNGFFDFDGSYIRNSYSQSTIRNRTLQQALDLTVTGIDGLDLIVGASYFRDRLFSLNPSTSYTGKDPTNPGTTPSTFADYNLASRASFFQTKEALAGYIDATFHVSDRLSINAGGRYSHEKQDVLAYQEIVVRNRTAANETFKKFTPRASIRYELAPRTNIYASYSKGFRSGAYNIGQLPACVNLPTVPADCFKPAEQETIDAFEVGFKTAGRKHRFEVAGFYYDYKNLQVSATRNLVINGATFPVTEISNAPKARIYGAEASFEIEPIDNLTIRGSGTWLHARYGDGFIFQSGVGVNPAAPGINASADPLKTYLNTNQVQDLSGLQMSRAPDFAANLGADYHIPNGEGGLRFSANVKYSGRYVVTNPSIWCQSAPVVFNGTTSSYNCSGVPSDRAREQRFTEGAFALLSGSITWTHPSGSYYLRIWGTNLTDHRYRLHYTGNAGNGTYAPMAEPRVFGGTLGYKL